MPKCKLSLRNPVHGGTLASVPQGGATRRQAKSLVGNACIRSLLCWPTLQLLALLDNTLVEFRVYQVP